MTAKAYDPTAPERYHALYCKLIHQDLPWRSDYRWPWELFALEFTEDDLRLVINYLNSKKARGRPVRSFIFRGFISGPSSIAFFSEDLSEAKAMSRSPRPTPRTAILAASGRPEPIKDTAKPVAAVMEQHKIMAKLLSEYKSQL